MPGSFVSILTANYCKMRLELVNNLTKNVYSFPNLEDKMVSRLFYAFDITLQEGMDDGEYSYTLYDDEYVAKATGLIQIGNYVPNNNTYTATTNNGGYVQYNGSI